MPLARQEELDLQQRYHSRCSITFTEDLLSVGKGDNEGIGLMCL